MSSSLNRKKAEYMYLYLEMSPNISFISLYLLCLSYAPLLTLTFEGVWRGVEGHRGVHPHPHPYLWRSAEGYKGCGGVCKSVEGCGGCGRAWWSVEGCTPQPSYL